jgi:zinc resistance-associated protein
MRKRFLTAAFAAAFIFPCISLAAPADSPEPFSVAPRVLPEDAEAFADAHIAALRAGLKLTQAQEKHWPALEAALRELAKTRCARMAELRDQSLQRVAHPDTIAALQEGAKLLSAHAADLEKLSGAAKPLYDSLDGAQKRRFGLLLRAATRHRALAVLREFHGDGREQEGFGVE